MSELDIALIPGVWIMKLLFAFLQIEPSRMEPGLFMVFAGIVSLVFWALILKLVWVLILRIFGIQSQPPPGRRF